MPNLVGTGLNQVPTNGMLGGMAYQSPDHASIKSLDLKNLSQINSEIGDNAVDVFVYDTSKDSDGGAWRKRTQSTSWYNETLGTATRGTRKEFPAVAVIVAKSNILTIYDGDDPDLPMWMVFEAQTPSWSTSAKFLSTSAIYSVSALNAKLVVGGEHGCPTVDFISESQINRGRPGLGSTPKIHKNSGNISLRNNPIGQYTSSISGGVTVNRKTRDVAMTVLPNAPIDPSTGLPIPTIAVATDSGLSIIKDDGSVVDYVHQNALFDQTSFVEFLSDNRVAYAWDFDNTPRRVYITPIRSADTTTVSTVSYPIDSVGTVGYGNPADVKTVGSYHGHLIGNDQSVVASMNRDMVAVGDGSDGLNLVDVQAAGVDIFGSRIAFITKDYNTGWQHGNIKGAFLSDTDTTDKTNGQTDPDRSVNNNPLTVYGTITKTPVATGADLVAYSGFSASNYLRGYMNISDPLTNFYLMGWFKHGNEDSTQQPVLVGDSNTYISITRETSSGDESWGFSIRGASANTINAFAPVGSVANVWNNIVLTSRGPNIELWVNGELIHTVSNIYSPFDWTNSNGVVPIQFGSNPGVITNENVTVSLVRFGESVPSPEQIKKIYEDEKVLFQENAKATLYGSSDAVTALAYDDTTNLLHVGTSGGRSTFSGLKRVENTTTAVATAISASNGLVAEQ